MDFGKYMLTISLIMVGVGCAMVLGVWLFGGDKDGH